MQVQSDLPQQDNLPVEDLSYEQALHELESIVTTLETEEQSLQEGLNLFARGQALIRHCANLLEKAELKVQQLSGEELVDFDPQTLQK